MSLPTKWFVERTPENAEILNKWAVGKYGHNHSGYLEGNRRHFILSQDDPGISSPGYVYVGSKSGLTDLRDYTEITFEQFKQEVLKETVMNKTNLPDTWCVKNDDSQKFKDTVIAYINENKTSGGTYEGNSLNSYYGLVKGISNGDISGKSFNNVILTLEEFITATNANLIGYKLKPDCDKYIPAIKLIASNYDKGYTPEWDFADPSLTAGYLRDASVLDLWFDPVFEKIAPKVVKLTLGDKGQELTISNKGSITSNNTTINIDQLKTLQNVMYGKISNKVGEWEIEFPQVKLGCTIFTLVELDKVIEEYNKLNN